MTATKDITIWCDGGPLSARMSCGKYLQGDSAKIVRRYAQRIGWTCAVQDPHSSATRDYCPDHKPTRDTPD